MWEATLNGGEPEECLLREVKRRDGLTLTSYQFKGIVTFISDQCEEEELMCLFHADAFEGQLAECNEGDLQWIEKEKVPSLPTWEGTLFFLNYFWKRKNDFSVCGWFMRENP